MVHVFDDWKCCCCCLFPSNIGSGHFPLCEELASSIFSRIHDRKARGNWTMNRFARLYAAAPLAGETLLLLPLLNIIAVSRTALYSNLCTRNSGLQNDYTNFFSFLNHLELRICSAKWSYNDMMYQSCSTAIITWMHCMKIGSNIRLFYSKYVVL